MDINFGEITDEDVWEVVNKFSDQFGMMHTQIDSYNEFVTRSLQDIISENRLLTVEVKDQKYTVEFSNPILQNPVHKENNEDVVKIYPKECVDRDISYLAHLYTDVTFTNAMGTSKLYSHVHIGSIPVMVGSKLCNLDPVKDDIDFLMEKQEDIYDQGGYFIIKGSEKIISNQQTVAYNKTYVFQNRKNAPKYHLYTEIKSSSILGFHTTKAQVGILKSQIGVMVPYIDMADIPLGVMFNALGAKSVDEILQYILPDLNDERAKKILAPSLEQSYPITSQDMALHFIGKRGKKFLGGKKVKKVDTEEEEGMEEDTDCSIQDRQIRLNAISYARYLLSTEFLPHLGVGEDTFVRKMYFLGDMTFKLLEVELNRKKPEDRDHYSNKRVATVGVLFTALFHNSFKRLKTEICNTIERNVRGGQGAISITTAINANTIKTNMSSAISANSWAGRTNAQGVSQAYEKFNYMMALANGRKLTTPMNSDGGKIEKPRRLDSTHWGIVCPAETPEGTKCLLMNTWIRTPSGDVRLRDLKNRDQVITVNPFTLEKEVTRIKNFFTTEKDVVRIKCDNEVQVTATLDHPFLTNIIPLSPSNLSSPSLRTWVEVKDLKVGNILIFVNKEGKTTSTKIISLEFLGKEEVGDFTTVSDYHSFIANGLVTHNCGLITSEAMTCLITIGSDPKPILEFVRGMSIINFHGVSESSENLLLLTKVYVNGFPVGVTKHPDSIVQELRGMRRSGGINPEISISYNYNTKSVQVYTDSGRLCRPLFVVEKGKLLLKKEHIEEIQKGEWDEAPGNAWTELLNRGLVELIDKAEEEYALIANFPSEVEKADPVKRRKYTHCEIHPSLIFGVGASVIPHADKNQSPRNCYQCLWVEEPVLMSDGKWKMIGDVEVGDEVLTFNPKTMDISSTKVIFQHTSPTEKRMVEVTTTSGRKIKVTEDHKIMTFHDGWIEAGELKETYYVGVYPSSEYKEDAMNTLQKGEMIFVSIKSVREIGNLLISDITTESENHSFFGGRGGFAVSNSAQGKQAIGVPGANFMFKTKGKFHALKYPQIPLVKTKFSELIGFDNLPCGQNAIVAICPWYGFNQEDSLVVNQDSIDGGFMVSITYMSFCEIIEREKDQQFEVPIASECSNFKVSSTNPDPTSKLDPKTGIIRVGEAVVDGDFLIGKTELVGEVASVHRQKKKNLSVLYDHPWPGKVCQVQRGVNGKGYDYYRVVVAQERKPQIGDKFCYTPDHEVLTEDGWIKIGEVTEEHSVATLNQDTHEIEYHNPTEIYSYDHDGDMVQVDSEQVSLCVTPNHKMYVRNGHARKWPGNKYKLVEAGTLNGKFVRYKKNGKWRGGLKDIVFFLLPALTRGNIRKYECNSRDLDIKPWIIFYGIWLAEGCADLNEVTIDSHKKRVQEALFPALDELGYEYKHRVSPRKDRSETSTDDRVLIRDKHLAFYMTERSVGATNKRMPEWVWRLDEELCRLFLDSMCLGDGHMNTNTPMYDTSSVGLKDDVMRLALHCGWSANAHIRYPEGYTTEIWGKVVTNTADSWRITIAKTQVEPEVNRREHGYHKVIQYSGKVHCFEIQNHVIYVRRSPPTRLEYQIPVWSGNSVKPGQKGVIGMTYRAHELPRTLTGVAPDILINPLAIPSRMTIGTLVELISGRRIATSSKIMQTPVNKVFRIGDFNPELKDRIISSQDEAPMILRTDKEIEALKLSGKDFGDSTPFQGFSIEEVCGELKRLGINEFSDEEMINGITGEKMKCLIFFGVGYYQRLKHMVIDKVHARSKGGRTRLTRQPREGRRQGGGLRIGTMERDCLLCQGAPFFAKDRLMEQSDETRMWFCRICGMPALVTTIRGEGGRSTIKRECTICSGRNVAEVKIPYATKLLMEELAGMNIIVRVLTTSFNNRGDPTKIFAGKEEIGRGFMV